MKTKIINAIGAVLICWAAVNLAIGVVRHAPPEKSAQAQCMSAPPFTTSRQIALSVPYSVAEVHALKGRYQIVGEWYLDTVTGKVEPIDVVYARQNPGVRSLRGSSPKPGEGEDEKR